MADFVLQKFKTLVQLTREFIQQEYALPSVIAPHEISRVIAPFVPPAPIVAAPAPVKQEIVLEIRESTTIVDDLSDLKKLVKTLFPQLPLLETIPDDAGARHVKEAWKKVDVITDVVILSFKEPPQELLFLENIAKALRHYGASASVIPAMKLDVEAFLQTSHLKLVIVRDHALYTNPELLKHQRESVRAGSYFLGKTPLLLLTDIPVYFKEPALKATLWKSLTTTLRL